MGKSRSYNSKHFQLEQLADGVYAAINTMDGWAICNAGVIDLGERTLIYDAFMTPAAATDLRAAVESLTGRPIHTVINSHYHNDHIWGNQAFAGETDIISDAKTRELIITEGAKEVQGFSQVIQKRLESVEAQLATVSEESISDDLRLHHSYYLGIAATLPILQVRLPSMTFTGEITFEGAKRSARLVSFEGGHCASDVVLYLPEDGIVFMEDLLFSGFHPYLEESDPGKIPVILEQIKGWGANTYVPGHGPIGGASELDWMVGYINCLNSLASGVIRRGSSEAELDKITIPREYIGLLFPQYFSVNLKFLYKCQMRD
jgi:cyclase